MGGGKSFWEQEFGVKCQVFPMVCATLQRSTELKQIYSVSAALKFNAREAQRGEKSLGNLFRGAIMEKN